MKKATLYYIWAAMAVLCALFGLIPAPSGALAATMTVLSLLFFVPPALLLVEAYKTGDRKTLKRLRLLSGLSLLLTVVLFIANILSMAASEAVGNVLYFLLSIVSVPMVCSGHWVLSLFLWACLLFCTWKKVSSDQK